jgi:hypothetical protein
MNINIRFEAVLLIAKSQWSMYSLCTVNEIVGRPARRQCKTVAIGKGAETVLTTRFSFFRFYAGQPSFTSTNSRTYKAEDASESAAATPATAYTIRL